MMANRAPIWNLPDDESQPQARRVAARALRTIPLIMGNMAAGLRGDGGDVHPSQFRLLFVLAHHPLTPGEIAAKMEVSLPTVSKALRVLERRSWIARTPDQADRRRVTITLTDEGRRSLRRAGERAVDQLSAAFESASPEELDSMGEGLAALARLLEGTRPHHPHCEKE